MTTLNDAGMAYRKANEAFEAAKAEEDEARRVLVAATKVRHDAEDAVYKAHEALAAAAAREQYAPAPAEG